MIAQMPISQIRVTRPMPRLNSTTMPKIRPIAPATTPQTQALADSFRMLTLAMICRTPIRIAQMAIRITMKPIVLPGQTRMMMPNSRLTMPRKTRRPTPEVPR